MKIGVILTGIIEEYYLDELISSYKPIINNLLSDVPSDIKLYTSFSDTLDWEYKERVNTEHIAIISTWSYTNKSIIEKLLNNGFYVVISEF